MFDVVREMRALEAERAEHAVSDATNDAIGDGSRDTPRGGGHDDASDDGPLPETEP